MLYCVLHQGPNGLVSHMAMWKPGWADDVRKCVRDSEQFVSVQPLHHVNGVGLEFFGFTLFYGTDRETSNTLNELLREPDDYV